jgi:ABC-2 type transport system permease protein
MIARVPVAQGWLFQKVRWRLVCNAGSLLFGNSRTRFIGMLASSALIWAALYYGAWEGFVLIRRRDVPFAGGLIELLFDAMFFTLGCMLVFSTGLILYASLFAGAESKFLLTTPARADQIFASKFQAAVVFSSWAFVVLGGPILIGYGVVFDVPWPFYALLPVWLIGYVILPGAAGAIISMLIVNFFPQRRKQALLALLALVVLGGGYWFFRVIVLTRASFGSRDALEEVFGMFQLARSPYSPSQWMSHGLLALARNDVAGSLLPLALIWSNALFLYVVAAFLAKKLYRRGFNRISEGGGSRRIYGSHRLDGVMEFLVGYLDPKTRLLVVKDFRTFRREPAQVGQLGLFAGLMLLCVVNIRQFFGADLPAVNQSVVSLLNLSATGLLMCAYLGRFVYPLLSLEGRKFWILGLLPLKREQLLWGKFVFAVTMTSVLAGGMVLVSDLVLDMPVFGIVLHQATIAALSFGLSGLCVGMSATMPNFRETDPSKIVVGFGGTMFTIASLMFLVLAIVAMCVPYHLLLARDLVLQGSGELSPWAYLGMAGGLAMAGAAVWLPLRLGAQTLRSMEF